LAYICPLYGNRSGHGTRRLVPLTPKQTATFDFLWEHEGNGRIGLEAYYIGEQQLERNPYRTRSIPY
jgi:hypothetical protein